MKWHASSKEISEVDTDTLDPNLENCCSADHWILCSLSQLLI